MPLTATPSMLSRPDFPGVEDAVDETVRDGLLGRREPVAVDVLEHGLDRPAGMPRDDLGHPAPHLTDLLGAEQDEPHAQQPPVDGERPLDAPVRLDDDGNQRAHARPRLLTCNFTVAHSTCNRLVALRASREEVPRWTYGARSSSRPTRPR